MRRGWLTVLRIVFVAGLFVSHLGLVFAQTTENTKLTAREIAKRSLPSVVVLVMTSGQDATTASYGSGFFVRDDIIATNYHVIHGADRGYAKVVGENTKYDLAGVVGIDRANDLALIKIRGIKAPALRLNSNNSLAIGDEVFAVGNPQGLEGTFSQGIISSIRRQDRYNLVQITASISPGSSGGPILNDQGEVVGVAVGAIEGGQSLNFAIPASFLSALLATVGPPISLAQINRSSVSNSREGIRNPDNREDRISSRPRRRINKTGLSEDKLVGTVRSVRISKYRPNMKFGRWDQGRPLEIETVLYDNEGEREFSERYFLGDFDRWSEIVGPAKPFEPYRGKYLYSRNTNSKTSDYYFGPLSGKAFRFNRRIISNYDTNGQLTEISDYTPDGALDGKKTYSRDRSGVVNMNMFQADGKRILRHREYMDTGGAEVLEEYSPPEKLSFKRITTRRADKIVVETFRYDDDDVSRTISVLDPYLEEPLEQVNYEPNGIVSWKGKYEYTTDSAGNWTKQVLLQQVTKFGRTYFEPETVIVREITYYSKSPSTNKPRRPK